MKNLLALTCVLMLAACGGGGSSTTPEIPQPPPTPPPTAEELALEDYVQIATDANLLLSTDRINWIPDQKESVRIPVSCRGMYCSIGFSAFIHSSKIIGIGPEDLAVLSPTQGINTGIAAFTTPYVDLHSYGGWMKHSFFASTVVKWLHEDDPDQGVIQAYGTVTGYSTSTNPEVEATYTGFVTARDHTVPYNLESVVTGDASIQVSIGEQVLVDVHLTDLVNDITNREFTDISFEDMPATDGQFSHHNADNNKLSGVFYGPDHEEVGGVFDHPEGLVGAYGGRKNE